MSERWLVVLAAVTIAGCGGAAQPYPSDYDVEPEREDPAALEREQVELERQLGEELSRPEPDCSAACSLSTRICELADRICGIAGRHTSDIVLASRCEDGNERCASARERVAERCACE